MVKRPYPDDIHPIGVRIDFPDHVLTRLGRGVDVPGTQVVFLPNRDFFRFHMPVFFARPDQQDPGPVIQRAGRIQQIDNPLDVHIRCQSRILPGQGDRALCRQMENTIRTHLLQQGPDLPYLQNIQIKQADPLARDLLMFELGGTDLPVTRIAQMADQIVPDKPCRPND